MRHAKIAVWAFSLLFVLGGGRAFSQFTAAEVAERAKWEDFLKTAEIVKWEEVGEGVTKPLRLYLKKGNLEARGVWKNPSGVQQGFLEGWQYEIAAYQMDKLINLNMVPPTVEREFQGKRGSLQLWVTSKYSLLKIMEQGVSIPESAREITDKMKYIIRAFDSLIANDDRTQQNILYTEDWRTIVIDHSRSFRSSKEFVRKLVYGRDGLKKTAQGQPILFRRLPRSLVASIRVLEGETIRQAVGPYLTKAEAEAVLARKKLLLDEVDLMVKEHGEDKVLY